jgi:hypothetical protein
MVDTESSAQRSPIAIPSHLPSEESGAARWVGSLPI